MRERTSPRLLLCVFLLELAGLIFVLWVLQSTERTEIVRGAIQSGLAWLGLRK
jgi:hypothetical protein